MTYCREHKSSRILALALGVGIITTGVFSTDRVNIYAQGTEMSTEVEALKNLRYLDEMTPTYHKSGEGANVDYGYKNRVDYENKPISININGQKKSLANGVSTHAPATLEYSLDGLDVNVFESYLALTDIKPGKVEYRIYLDGVLQYASGEINNNTTQLIRVNVKDAHKLKIVIDHLGSTSYDHAILGNARLYKKDIDENALSSTSISDPGFSFKDMNNAKYRLNKDQYLFLESVGKVPLFTLATESPESLKFVKELLDSPQVLRYYNTAGNSAGRNKIGFLRTLKRIYEADSEALSNPDSQKIATAVAMEYANGPIRFWANGDVKSDAVKRYKIYRDLNRKEGELMPIFKTLDIELMRNVVSAEVSDEDILWLREKIKREKPELLVSNDALSGVTHQYIAYNTYNRFGDWVQAGGYYGYNPSLATVVDIGGVCGSISKFDVVSLRSFGVPASLIGQPGHAAVVYMRDDGTWSRANNISSWADSQGGTSTILAEGSGGNNASYNILSIAARKNPQNYELAKYYFAESKLKTGDDRLALWEKTLDLTPEYVPVYREMMKEMESRNAKPEEWYQLSLRILKNFRNYPKPMIDLLNISTPHFNRETAENWPLLADFAVKYVDTVDSVTEGKARDVYDNTQIENGNPFSPDYKNYYNKYSTLLGSFSFDGPFANRLRRARAGSEYSLDGGVSFKPILEDNPLIPLRDTAKITEENGIIIRLKGMEKGQKIKFKASQPPTNLKVNDEEDFIVGLNGSYEYSLDNGESWISGDITPNLSGDKTVLVRVKRAGTNLGSDPVSLHFTSSINTPSRILHSNMRIVNYSTQQNDTDQAARNSINGDKNDFWHTVWRGGDVTPHLTIGFDREYNLRTFNYLPRQDSGTNGNILEYTISVSDDGNSWREVYHGNFSYKNGNDKAEKTQELPQGSRARFVKLTVLNGMGKFASAADISFGIDQEEANLAKASHDQKLEENLKPQYIKNLKNILADAGTLRFLLNFRQVNDPQLTEKLASFIDRVNTAQNIDSTEEMARELSALSEEYKKINDEVIWAYNKTLLSREATDVSGRYEEIKKDEEEKAKAFKEEYANLLSLTVDNVSLDNYNDLMKAKYVIFNKSPYTQELLQSDSQHIQELLDALGKKADFISNEEEGYRQAFGKIIGMDANSLNQDNYNSVESEIIRARIAFQSLSPSVKTALGNLETKFTELEARLGELKVEKVRNRVEKYIEAHRGDFAGKDKVEDVWNQAIAKADSEIHKSEVRSNIAKMEDIIFKLETKHAQLLYAEWQSSDDEDRINKFKNDFSSLLSKDIESVTSADKDALSKAMDSFRRLNDYQQSQLTTERERLLEINKKLFENQDKANYVQDLINKLEVNLNTSISSARAEDRSQLEGLRNRVRSLKNDSSKNPDEKLEIYSQIEKARMDIVKAYSPAKEKARFSSLGMDSIMSLKSGELSLEDKNLLEAEKEKINSLPSKERDYLSDQINHLNILDRQMERLENPDNAEDLEIEAELRKRAIEEIKALNNLNDYERNRFVEAIKSADTDVEIQTRLRDAKIADRRKIETANKKEEKIRKVMDYLDSLVNTENPNYQPWAEELTPKVRLILNDYTRDYLEQYNEGEIQWIYDQIVKRVAVLRSQSEDIIANRLNKAEYDSTMDKFKKVITDAESLLEDSSNSNHAEEGSEKRVAIKSDKARAKLNKLLEDAKFAKEAGLSTNELKNYMNNFESKLDEICQEEKAANAKKAESTAETNTQADQGESTAEGEGSSENNPQGDKRTEDSASKADEKNNEANSEANKEANNQASSPNSSEDSTSDRKDSESKESEKASSESGENEKVSAGSSASENREESEPLNGVEDSASAGEDNSEDNGVCLIPEESAHNKAIKEAIDRISKLKNLDKKELEDFSNELTHSHAGCDLNEIIIRAERKDAENLNKKTEEEARHSVLVENASKEIRKLKNLTDSDIEDFIKNLEKATNNEEIEKIVEEAKIANEKVNNTGETAPTTPPSSEDSTHSEVVPPSKAEEPTHSEVVSPGKTEEPTHSEVASSGKTEDSTNSETESMAAPNVDANKNVNSRASSGSIAINLFSSKDTDGQSKKYSSERIAGKDRIETSIKLAKKLYPNGAKTIFIVNKEKFADSLATTALAKEMKAPILYTDKDSTPEQIVTVLKDLGAKKLVFIGGEGAISSSQIKELENKGYDVDRMGGVNRYETASILAEQLLKMKNNKPKEVILASAENYADALSISAYCAKKSILILLVGKDNISKENERIFKKLGNPTIHIVGGENSISKKLESYIEKLTKSKVNRLAGKDRYETSNIISEKFAPNAKTAVVASGERFEDALLSGLVAANDDSTLILCKKDGLTVKTEQYIKNSKIEDIKIIGGENTISNKVVEELEKLQVR